MARNIHTSLPILAHVNPGSTSAWLVGGFLVGGLVLLLWGLGHLLVSDWCTDWSTGPQCCSFVYGFVLWVACESSQALIGEIPD